jgi:outer membrane protein assembly factor BamB
MKYIGFSTITAVFIAITTFACEAKIVDCSPIVIKNTEYSSHSNYVQAVNKSTGKRLWKTVLFKEIYTQDFNPKLEEDVQWNIACILEVRKNVLVITDNKKRTFHVNKLIGNII